MRRATCAASITPTASRNFYPRSPCGERRITGYFFNAVQIISIHALLAESDYKKRTKNIACSVFLSTLSLRRATEVNNPVLAVTSISIHALLAESDIVSAFKRPEPSKFLSTLSLRRATDTGLRQDKPKEFLSTLSLRRATSAGCNYRNARLISIHALLAESDAVHFDTLSALAPISIHALLAESDDTSKDVIKTARNFYPRSPCGERPMMPLMGAIPILFLSTLSLRRATCYSLRHSAQGWHFYPRSPCGERQNQPGKSNKLTGFLSTLSLRRATCYCSRRTTSCWHFYPRSPCGERQRLGLLGWLRTLISIHALLAESDIRTCQYFFSNF